MRHGRRQHDLIHRLAPGVLVILASLTSGAIAADPAPAQTTAAAPQAVPYWQATALPTAVIEGGAIPPNWQPQAVPYQGVGPDGQPITMYFAPTYVFTYPSGPPVPAVAVPQPVNNRPGITRPGVPGQPQPPATTGGWNYATTGATPVPTTMSLQPGAYTQYRPVYQFPADSRALTGTPLVPPGALPQSTTSAFAAAPPTMATAPTTPPAYGPPPNGWAPADPSALAASLPPPPDQWAAAAPVAAAGTAAGIAAAQSMPPPSAAIASPTMAPVAPPEVPVTPASSLPQAPSPSANKHLWRVVGVYDGDTVTCLDENNQQQKVRLAEIDAPESGQDFGKVSREALAALVFGRTVEVTDQGRDRYGRWIANLSVDGIDVNRQMVATGNAWVYTAYSNDPAMAEAQKQAQAARIGLWAQDNPVPPWDYRKNGK